MKLLEKTKAQKSLTKIESGEFDENDVDNIFMRLRAYSFGNKVFHEVAHFVAHNDERDRGITFESLEAVYLSFKFFLEYTSPKKPLDISKPFPSYIKKLMKFQVDKCEDSVLKEKFSINRDRLKKRIDTIFTDDKKQKLTFLKKPVLLEKNFKSLQHLLGFISTKPTFNQEQLIAEFVSVLKANKLEFDEDALRESSSKITLCVLLLINGASFKVSKRNSGYCKISCENTAISHNQIFVDQDGKPIKRNESHGMLQLTGHVVLENNGKDVTIGFPMMDTNLSAEGWCDKRMFYIEPISEQTPDYLQQKINFNSDLCLNKDGKLGILG